MKQSLGGPKVRSHYKKPRYKKLPTGSGLLIMRLHYTTYFIQKSWEEARTHDIGPIDLNDYDMLISDIT